jgi:DNA repair exonuclease SbcCD nuclease subunit
VYVFRREEVSSFSFPALGVTVYGYAFCSAEHAAPVLPSAAERGEEVGILLAHADFGVSVSSYAPLSAQALEQSGFAYAALGHVHRPEPARRVGKTTVSYCGFFAGRGFDETGAGGARMVEIADGAVKVTPVESGANRFLLLPVDCTGAESGDELRDLVRSALATLSPDEHTAVRAVLCGEVVADCTPDTYLLSRLGQGFAHFEVKDETLPLYDVARLMKDPTLMGAFYRAMQPRLQSEDEEERLLATEALRLGLAVLMGREVSYAAD